MSGIRPLAQARADDVNFEPLFSSDQVDLAMSGKRFDFFVDATGYVVSPIDRKQVIFMALS